MSLFAIALTVLSAGFMSTETHAAPPTQTAPIPSIDMTAGPGVDICTSTSFPTPTWVRWDGVLRSYADEMIVPGYGNVAGFTANASPTLDTAGTHIWNPAPYTVPAGTVITLRITSYLGPDQTGGISYVDTMDVDCTTGLEINPPQNRNTAEQEEVPVPGCDLGMPISATSVVGTFVETTSAYWTPGEMSSDVTLVAGQSAWVLGVDESGMYYQIVWSCDLLWVPVEMMGPTYDDVWNGTPLPTDVVN